VLTEANDSSAGVRGVLCDFLGLWVTKYLLDLKRRKNETGNVVYLFAKLILVAEK
jgi:hypothetical protein